MHVKQNNFVRPDRLSELLPESSAVRPKGEGVLESLPPLEPRPVRGRGVFTNEACFRLHIGKSQWWSLLASHMPTEHMLAREPLFRPCRGVLTPGLGTFAP